MKAQEKTEVISLITTKAKKRGIPMNVRTGGNDDLAEWIQALLEELLPIDEPTGTIDHSDYMSCPKCGKSVGTTGYYCRYCGNYLRWKPEGGK